MRPLRYSINVTLDGCCDHRAITPDEKAALRWHPEGYTEPRHYHTAAAHSIYVLEWRLDVGDVEAGPGHCAARR